MSASTDVSNDLKARVFLSCGQSGGEEEETAKELGGILEDSGYEVYIAKQQVNLQGVKEAIFPQLRDADYLVFVDFPRDALPDGRHRGSLFSHQELAIASFLDIPYIGFRHKSVRREGLSDFLLSNVPEFNGSIELPKLLRGELERRRDWDPQSRRQLKLSRVDPSEGDDMITGVMTDTGPANLKVRYFHLTVQNLHRDRIAIGCTAYVEKIKDAKSGQSVGFRPAELKWAGTTLPSVPVIAGGQRDIDACRIFEAQPRTIHFVSLSDSGKHMAPIAHRAVDVSYVVLSENFPPARCTLRIEPGPTPQGATAYQLDSPDSSE